MTPFVYTLVEDPEGNHYRLPVFMTQTVIDSILAHFVVRDYDLFIVTYPRSGTTWMQQIVHLLANNGVQGNDHLEVHIPYLERAAAFKGISSLEQKEGRRYFKTHLPFTFGLHTRNLRTKFIYVARNPKDCALSLYYFMSNNYRIAYKGSWEEFLHLFIAGDLIYGKWSEHVMGWWHASREFDNILFLTYESIHRNLKGIISHVARFMETSVTPEVIDQIVRKTSFSEMVSNPKTNLSWAAWRKDASTQPLRKGCVGEWQPHFNPEQSSLFDAMCREMAAMNGPPFVFA
jgi:hypothetical protein